MARSSTTIKKGEVRNPSGRAPVPDWAKQGFKSLTPLAMEALKAVLDGTDTDAKTSDRLKAADIVFDRTLGKPMQQIISKTTVSERKVDLSGMTKEQIDLLIDTVSTVSYQEAESPIDTIESE